jgi:hypothetical protein
MSRYPKPRTAPKTRSLAPPRDAAARRNGARAPGAKTPAGKARSAQNALNHGLCADEFVVLHDEDEHAFEALEASVHGELAPQGALQRFLAGRIVRAAWRLERAERIEIELLEERMDRDGDLALALIRDGNGTRSIDTLMRYRGSAQAELYKALRTLKALQAEPAARAGIQAPRPRPAIVEPTQRPDEPKSRRNAGDSSRPGNGAAAGRDHPTPSVPRTSALLAGTALGTSLPASLE